MEKRNLAAYTAVFLLIAFSITMGESVDEEVACGTVTVECICEEGDYVLNLVLIFEVYMIQDPQTGEMKCSQILDPHQVCANYSCEHTGNVGLSINDKLVASELPSFSPWQLMIPHEEPDDSETEVSLNYVPSHTPRQFMIPSGGYSDGHPRFTRESDPCHVKPLHHATVKCWEWSYQRKCDIRCLSGYAFQLPKNSTALKSAFVECIMKENVWKPHGFIECNKYLNCHAHLITPGKLFCKLPVEGPAYCEIYCYPFGGHEATPLKKYECIDKDFHHSLPHCAVQKDGVPKKPK